MNRNRPYLNRFVKQKELQLTDTYHGLNMRQIKPITSRLMEHTDAFTINNSKRQMMKEVKDIQIERENKLLLSKIERVMAAKGKYSVARTKSVHNKANKSLNDIVRRRQMATIELENKRFLLRLQSRKPTVDNSKLRRDWQDNKGVIKRMTNLQFNLTHFKSTKESKIRSVTSERLSRSKIQDIKINKWKDIDGQRMLIKVEFAEGMLKIVGDCRDHKDLKVIEIPRQQGLQFIQKDCEGKLENLLDKLKYDHGTETLYLISETIEEDRINPENIRKDNMKKLIETLPVKPVSTIEYFPKVPIPQNYQYQTISHPSHPPQEVHGHIEDELPKKQTKQKSRNESSKKLLPAIVATSPEPQEKPNQRDNNEQSIHQNEVFENTVEQKAREVQIAPDAEEDYNQEFQSNKQKQTPETNLMA